MSDILIYCRSGDTEGWGHIVRCRHLAQALMGKGHDVAVLNGDEKGVKYLAQHGVPNELFSANTYSAEERRKLNEVSAEADCVIVDVRINDDDLLYHIRQKAKKLIVIVGAGYSITEQTHWLADMVIYQAPYMPDQIKKVPMENVVSGLNNIIMAPNYHGPHVSWEGRADIIFYIGGGLPKGYAEEVIDAFKEYDDISAIELGVFKWVNDVCEQLSRAKFFAGTMGMIVYEAMAAGLYPIVMSRSKDHERIAAHLAIGSDAARLTNLGLAKNIPPALFVELSARAMRYQLKRHNDGQPPHYLQPDGFGVYRVAERIIDIL